MKVLLEARSIYSSAIKLLPITQRLTINDHKRRLQKTIVFDPPPPQTRSQLYHLANPPPPSTKCIPLGRPPPPCVDVLYGRPHTRPIAAACQLAKPRRKCGSTVFTSKHWNTAFNKFHTCQDSSLSSHLAGAASTAGPSGPSPTQISIITAVGFRCNAQNNHAKNSNYVWVARNQLNNGSPWNQINARLIGYAMTHRLWRKPLSEFRDSVPNRWKWRLCTPASLSIRKKQRKIQQRKSQRKLDIKSTC